MTTIQGNASITPSASLESQTAELRAAAATSPEAALALAALSVEESADRAREVRTSQRQARGSAQRAAIGKKRKAARIRLAGAVVQGATNVASSIASGVKQQASGSANADGVSKVDAAGFNQTASRAGNMGAALDSAGGITSGAAGMFATVADTEADAREAAATEAGERAQDAGEYADALDRHRGKMMQGGEDIGRLRHEAMMAALRG